MFDLLSEGIFSAIRGKILFVDLSIKTVETVVNICKLLFTNDLRGCVKSQRKDKKH